ncbi:MAG: glycosyltransferase family 2 protein [Bacillota bacterium]|jgi:glycosyltransferase involved in cell wall biosynthesis
MTPPFLSIVVPIYQVEQYLRQCVDSILSQTFSDFELILVDDGSPDTCPKICDEYVERDTRVSVIHTSNKGSLKARATGIRRAKGQYVGFVDSDDWISPSMYERLIRVAIDTGADCVIGNGLRIPEKGKPRDFANQAPCGYYDKKDLFELLYPQMLGNKDLYGNRRIQPSLCLKIFRRELIENAHEAMQDSIVLGEDMACTYTSILQANSIYIMDKSFKEYYYRYNSQSITWRYKQNLLTQSMDLCRFLKNNPVGLTIPEYQRDIDYEICFFAIQAYYNIYLTSNSLLKAEKLAQLEELVTTTQIYDAMDKIDWKTLKFPNTIILRILASRNVKRISRMGSFLSAFRPLILQITKRIL